MMGKWRSDCKLRRLNRRELQLTKQNSKKSKTLCWHNNFKLDHDVHNSLALNSMRHGVFIFKGGMILDETGLCVLSLSLGVGEPRHADSLMDRNLHCTLDPFGFHTCILSSSYPGQQIREWASFGSVHSQ